MPRRPGLAAGESRQGCVSLDKRNGVQLENAEGIRPARFNLAPANYPRLA
jgi:hypothetical protein